MLNINYRIMNKVTYKLHILNFRGFFSLVHTVVFLNQSCGQPNLDKLVG